MTRADLKQVIGSWLLGVIMYVVVAVLLFDRDITVMGLLVPAVLVCGVVAVAVWAAARPRARSRQE